MKRKIEFEDGEILLIKKLVSEASKQTFKVDQSKLSKHEREVFSSVDKRCTSILRKIG